MTIPSTLAEHIELLAEWRVFGVASRTVVLTVGALILDRIWRGCLSVAWRLGLDRHRRLSYSVPLLRIVLVVAVPLGALHALWAQSPTGALVTAAVAAAVILLVATDHLRDMIGGIALAVTRPFRVGDTIRIGPIGGCVEQIGLTRCRLRGEGGESVRVPNRQVARELLRVAHRGAALPTDTEVRFPAGFGTALALSALRDQAYLSAYTDASAPVVVELLGDARARIRATPIRQEDAAALASDLISRAESLLGR
jgi:hypothetical protein